ncbi:amino acid ABC transporter ATP-binding protein [Candidatus Bipolaricaulota bacterium]|nr:amino acid ABC transporter ATP-binding protein [Candidatus Bipolaricaulota bacterium]
MANEKETLIKIDEVGKWYEDVQALDGISMEIDRKDVVVICGPSGCGKSTLLRCINGLEEFEEGDVIVDGVSVREVRGTKNIYKLRSKIGMVFQHFELYPHLTALENVTLAPKKVFNMSKKEARQKGMELLERVGIPEQADQKPGELSGGQQQRVGIARAIAMDPQTIMFDEPTSALDPEMIRDVLEVMADLAKEGLTMIVVTHEMGFAKEVADEIAFMENGNIVEHNDVETFFKNPESERAKEFVDRVLVHI